MVSELVDLLNADSVDLLLISPDQYANVYEAFSIIDTPPSGAVFLVDDLVDSKWTLTEIGRLLREHGSGFVYPLALASTMGRDS